MGKRGEILASTVLFIILNLIFLSILVIFIVRHEGGVVSLEEVYAKQFALALDAARPGMKLTFDFSKGSEADAAWFRERYVQSVRIDGNIVRVQLSEQSGYEYSFFNDVAVGVDVYPEGTVVFLVHEKEDFFDAL